MRLRALLATLPLVLFAAAGCTGDSTEPVDDNPLVGNWEADPRCLWECWFTVRSVSDPADSVNFTNQLSARFELDLRSNGRFQVQLSVPSVNGYQDSGTFTSTNSMLVLVGSASVDTLDYQLASPLLRLEFRNKLTFVGLGGDGLPDTVTVAATLKKF